MPTRIQNSLRETSSRNRLKAIIIAVQIIGKEFYLLSLSFYTVTRFYGTKYNLLCIIIDSQSFQKAHLLLTSNDGFFFFAGHVYWRAKYDVHSSVTSGIFVFTLFSDLALCWAHINFIKRLYLDFADLTSVALNWLLIFTLVLVYSMRCIHWSSMKSIQNV